jgi:hypothetical protein
MNDERQYETILKLENKNQIEREKKAKYEVTLGVLQLGYEGERGKVKDNTEKKGNKVDKIMLIHRELILEG